MKTKLFFCLVAVALVSAVALPPCAHSQFVKTLWRSGGGSVVEVSDGGLVVTGGTESSVLLLTKFDGLGNHLWTRTLGGSWGESGFSVVEVSDSGLVVTGHTSSYGAGGPDLLLAKFDGSGNHLWTRTLGDTSYEVGCSVVEVSDGGLVVTGRTESYGYNYDLLLAKFDSSGNHLWTRTLGESWWYDDGWSVVEVSDSGLVVTGETNSYGPDSRELLLAKFDGSGNHLWTRTLGGASGDVGYSVVEVSDSGLVVTGMTQSYGAGSDDLLLAKFDGSGNWLWTKTLGGSDWDRGYSVVEVFNGGVVVTGMTESYGSGYTDLLLAKFDGSGNTCLGDSVIPEVNSVSPIITSPSPTITTPSPTITSPSPTVASPTPDTTVVCEGCGFLGFFPNPDGWQFANADSNMWPEDWWGGNPPRFDYCQYPYPWLWCFLCSPADFPDWPLFVSAFGRNQCYYDPPPGRVIYKLRAVARWFAMKGAWGGSCFGFAISSFLFFDGFLDVSEEFPGYAQVYSVPINDESRLMVNKYWIYQFGRAQQQHIEDNFNSTTPNQTLLVCKSMFNTPTRDDRILVLFDKGGHAVNPYRCEVDPEHPEITHVYVYDNNHPGEDTWRVSINTNTNTWSYDGLPGWGGDKHLFLMEPVSNYTTTPILPISIPPRDRWISEKTAIVSQFVEFYISTTDTTLFESSAGSIGRIGDSLFTTLSEGHPIIPITGQETLPIGYYLLNDAWRCQFSGLRDSTFRLSLFTDSTVLVYSRTGADSTQSEELRYPGNDSTLWVGNPDPSTRPYDLEVISVTPDSEIVCEIQNISIEQNDSACYSITPLSGLQLDNYGEEKTYDLQVEIARADTDAVFFHEGIPLTGNTAHQIIPDWRQNGDTLTILVDEGMEGDFSDTIRVANEWEPITTREPKILPTKFFLSQNYPNPFNSTTQIKYSLPRDCWVRLEVYNILGQEIRRLVDEEQNAGLHTLIWDATDNSGRRVLSGPYFLRLQAGEHIATRKLSVTR